MASLPESLAFSSPSLPVPEPVIPRQGATAVYGVYSRKMQLQSVITTFNQAGFSDHDICLLLAPTHPIALKVRDMRSLACDFDGRPDAASLLKWLTRLGAVAISDVGLFIRSRSFLQAFICSTEESGYRRWETLSNLGIAKEDVKRLGSQIDEAGSLVYLKCDPKRLEQALQILNNTGASETSCVGATSYNA